MSRARTMRLAALAAFAAVAAIPARAQTGLSQGAPLASPPPVAALGTTGTPIVSTGTATPLPYPAGAVVPGDGGAPWSEGDRAALRRDVDALIVRAPALRGAHVGVVVLDAASGAALYRSNADDEFQPASTTKLVAGSAALDRLGPAFRYRTTLDTVLDRDGSTSLSLRAGGDPLLAESDLAEAAAAVKASGLRDLADLRIDDAHDVAPRYPDGWVWDDFGQDYAARPDAASVEENVVHLHVRPGSDVGEKAIVAAEGGIAVNDDDARDCVDAYASGRPIVNDRVTTGAAGAERDVDVTIDRGGCPTVFGTMPLGGAMHSIDVAVESPVAYVRAVLRNELALAGVSVPELPTSAADGERYGERAVRERLGPIAGTLWQHDSSPLAAWLGPDLWIPSDNFVAEMLLDELGAAAGGAPGSTAKGLTYERHWLRSLGIDLSTVTLADGSGLSQYDRLTPSDLATILLHDWNAHRDVVLRSLPIGGLRGTIESLTGTPLTGRIFAKTGNMSHVHGLAGYLATQRHGTAIFAFLVDDCNPPYAAVSALRARALSRIVTAP